MGRRAVSQAGRVWRWGSLRRVGFPWGEKERKGARARDRPDAPSFFFLSLVPPPPGPRVFGLSGVPTAEPAVAQRQTQSESTALARQPHLSMALETRLLAFSLAFLPLLLSLSFSAGCLTRHLNYSISGIAHSVRLMP